MFSLITSFTPTQSQPFDMWMGHANAGTSSPAHGVFCKSRRKTGGEGSFVSAHVTFLCAKLKACLVKSRSAAIADMWCVCAFIMKSAASDIMLAWSVESERLCSLSGPEWASAWDQSVRSLTAIHRNNVCDAKKKKKFNEGHVEHLVMVTGRCWRVSLPTDRKTQITSY